MEIIVFFGICFIYALCTKPALTLLVFLPLMLVAILLVFLTGAVIIF